MARLPRKMPSGDSPRTRTKRAGTLRPAFPPELPISARRGEILDTLRAHQVVIIAGDTGSGKTTQLPKMCLELGREAIACTQPRRVAAVSLSQRVAAELKVPWGREVGCKIRFMDRASPETLIKFVTDGMLLSEVQSDPTLARYDTIIVDEAHERSLNIDFLLGHLNQLRHSRPDLKIIITSATIDTAAFSRAFDDAPVIEVSGRLYPVEVIYSPVDELREEAGDFTHIDAVAAAVEKILIESHRGDILVFLATERDIREAADLLTARKLGPLTIAPLFGRLGSRDQQRVFAPSRHRKVILSTNIAETSLTIPGIRFVVDTGEARVSRFNSRTRTRRLPIEPVARSSADQRKGRCGRVAEGVCIRLYSEADYLARPEFTPPEIHRANLADVILRMKSAQLGEIEHFPFIDPPPPAAIRFGYQLLEELGALDEERGLTPIGKALARLPVDPIVGRILLQAVKEGSLRELLVIAAALSIQDPRERPAEAEAAADSAHRRFVHPDSDFLTLLAIWDAFHTEIESLSQGRLRRFCREHFLNYSRMREWRDIHSQLEEAMTESRDDRASEPPATTADAGEADFRFGGVRYREIHRALVPGLLATVARREDGNAVRVGGDRAALVFPGSTLFVRQAKRDKREKTSKSGRRPRHDSWLIAGEIVETARLYARTCARIEVSWLLELGAHVCRVSYSEPAFAPESGRVLVRETTRLHGLEIRTRSIGYDRIDSGKATEIFVREGLVNDTIHRRFAFLEHNRRVRDKVEVLRTKMRGSHYLDLDEALFQFYAKRLENVSSVHDLQRLIRDHFAGDESRLFIQETDLLGRIPDDFDLSAFPDSAALENSALPLRYAYRPGQEEDGVTLRLEPAQVRSLHPGMLDWLIPGHMEEKLTHLLRGLPKEIRRQIVPIPEKAAAIARALKPTHLTLVESLAAHLEKAYGIRTFPSDWRPEEMPDHLRVRVEVVGTDGEPLTAARDVEAVQAKLVELERGVAKKAEPELANAWRRACLKWEQSNLETFPADDLPDRIPVAESTGLTIHAYPGFRLTNDAVDLRLFRTPEEAATDLPAALVRFFEHELRYELAWLDRDLKDANRLGPAAVALLPLDTLKDHIRENLRRFLCVREVQPTTRADFERQVEASKRDSKGLLWKLLDQLEAIFARRQELALMKDAYPGLSADLARLLPPDFLLRTPYPRVSHLARYLEAMLVRARKARENPARDAQRAETVARFQRRLAGLRKNPRIAVADLADLFWMLEEFRVSLFAQAIGTAVPVSEKRIEHRFTELGG